MTGGFPSQRASIAINVSIWRRLHEADYTTKTNANQCIFNGKRCKEYLQCWMWLRPFPLPWRRHQIETFSTLLALCVGNSPVTGEFPAQKPVTRSFDASFDQRLNQRLSKQSPDWWFETPSHPLWRHCNTNTTSRGDSARCWRFMGDDGNIPLEIEVNQFSLPPESYILIVYRRE